MRSVKLAGLVALVLTASCAINVTTDGSGGSRPQTARAAPPPPKAAPPPAAPAPPAPAPPSRGTVGLHRRPSAPPAPAPSPTQATAVSPLDSQVKTEINLVKVRELKARNPKQCGYIEVAPGNWTHVDCDQYKASTHAIRHLSLRKLRLVQSKKTMTRPIRALKRRPTTTTPAGVGAAPAPTGGPLQITAELPDTVDHRTENLEGPIKNQGGVGSCTAHSLSAALDNAAIRAGVLQSGDKGRAVSPLHIWSRYGLPDMGAAADGNIAQPATIYTTWPQSDREACMLFQGDGSYAQDCSQTYNVKAGSWRSDNALMAKYNKAQAEGVYKISSIEKLEVGPPNINEMKSILSSGADIWAAFLIEFPAWSNRGMKDAVIPHYTTRSGGHAVLISGYRDTPSGTQFLIHNSWGESWGDKGYAWVTEPTVNKWLYYAYKVKITNGVKKEDLTDDDCAPDELVDLGTGLCAIMCDTGDGRPNNGCH